MFGISYLQYLCVNFIYKHVTQSAGFYNLTVLLCFFVSYKDAKALVTIGEGKYYCLGMDLEQIATMPGLESLDFVYEVQVLLSRLLTFPLVTVAAVNGEF